MNDTIIIGVSGKKRSGKDSLCKYLQAWYFCNFEQKDVTFKQRQDGKIVFNGRPGLGDDTVQDYDCKIYSFADPLKKFCIEIMGLTYENCYGTEEEKNSFSNYRWNNLPLLSRIKYSKYYIIPRSGFMTAREILQYVGTDIFRNMFSNTIWVNATIDTIKRENKKIALIADIRFESEIDAIMNEKNGCIIRLKRKIADDEHTSETQLDNFDFSQFGDRSLVIDNREMTIEEQCEKGLEFFQKILKKE
jgi:hypothetical protein